MSDKKIILFDGVCNFCNFWVKFAAKNNSKRDIFFLALQDDRAVVLLDNFAIKPESLSTVIFLHQDKMYTQSTAAFQICRHLDFPWKLAAGLLIIPKPIMDFLYNIIARNRYKWFGKSDSCMMPTADLKKQFL